MRIPRWRHVILGDSALRLKLESTPTSKKRSKTSTREKDRGRKRGRFARILAWHTLIIAPHVFRLPPGKEIREIPLSVSLHEDFGNPESLVGIISATGTNKLERTRRRDRPMEILGDSRRETRDFSADREINSFDGVVSCSPSWDCIIKARIIGSRTLYREGPIHILNARAATNSANSNGRFSSSPKFVSLVSLENFNYAEGVGYTCDCSEALFVLDRLRIFQSQKRGSSYCTMNSPYTSGITINRSNHRRDPPVGQLGQPVHFNLTPAWVIRAPA